MNWIVGLLFVLVVSSTNSFGQKTYNINWKAPVLEKLSENHVVTILSFEGASYPGGGDNLPRHVVTLPLNGLQVVSEIGLNVTEESVLEVGGKGFLSSEILSNEVQVRHEEIKINDRIYQRVEILPLYKRGQSVYKIDAFTIEVKYGTRTNNQRKSSRNSWAANSVLSGGTWYKVAITENGVYQINQAFLKSLGIDPDDVNLNALRIYGNGGGMLPESNIGFRYDDLQENAVWISNPNSTSFGKDDYALFYAEGPHSWRQQGDEFFYDHNVYSDTNYYFLTFNGGVGTPKRISNQSNISSSNAVNVTTFNDYASHELDLSNLISSGRQWYGENFGIKPSQYIEFEFPNIVSTEDVVVRNRFAMRSVNSTSTMNVGVSNVGNATIVGGRVGTYYLDAFAQIENSVIRNKPSGSKLGISMNFIPANSEATAWLDQIVVNCKRELIMTNAPLRFQTTKQSESNDDCQFTIENISSSVSIWDITDPTNVKSQQISLSSRTARFVRPGGSVEQFYAFTHAQAQTPLWGIPIANQNLHSLSSVHPDMVIYAPPMFLDYAEEVADFHRESDEMSVEVVNTLQVYNEFSSGRQDVVALRDFMKMLYDVAAGDSTLEPRYLLLFGDASYDYKYRTSGNTNMVPIYQYTQSLEPIASIATDDFYSFLDDSYSGIRTGIAELGVGRFPVKTTRQAAQAVNKLKSYNTVASLGKWRNELVYVGDDEDGGLHMRQASGLADTVDFLYPTYNVNKVLCDAYPQRSTPGGDRYPDVNDLIDDAVERGSLTLNYVGHGGELGWAHERILEVSQINKWNNIQNLPLFVTATCEFSRFDDPKRTAAGEFVFLNPDGGGIGLLTTTRVVYATPNYSLAQAFNQIAFREYNGEMPRLGDIVRLTKIRPNNLNDNARAFALLGDPALRLNYPEHSVETVSRPDTISALSVVNIEAEVINRNTGSLFTDFNGTAYVTVYDKKRSLETLDNDGEGPESYRARTNILFRGKSTVQGGKFKVSFVVPKDIDFSYGLGKISYYVENGSIDGGGFDTSIVVGGQSGDPTSDQEGPLVQLYMNDSSFVFGGMTNESPDIYAKLFDDNGINTSGSGIGHDIVAVLDEDTKNELILNDYYESTLNSYQSGSIKYPFKDLSDGRHTLTLKAWDTYNNSGTDQTEFVVSESAELALDHVLNYPNPFSTKTEFYFEHNYPNDDLAVRIQIFTVSGKIVKTIDGFFMSEGFRIGPIPWDGKDDFGDKIGTGVYIYKVQVKATNGEAADQFEKLVILN